MDKLMNAAGAVSNERRAVKFELENPIVSTITVDMLKGLFDPIGLHNCEEELFNGRDEYLWSRDISKNFILVVKNHVEKLFQNFSKITFIEHYTMDGKECSTNTVIAFDNVNTKLCDVGEYTDTYKDRWSNEDHDQFEIHNDYVFVTKRKSSSVKNQWSDVNQTVEMTIIRANDFMYEGLTEIPKTSSLLNTAVYKDVTIKRNVKFNNTELVSFTPTYNDQSSNRLVVIDEGYLLSEGKGNPMIEYAVKKPREGEHKLKVHLDLENNLTLTSPASGEIDILKVAGEVTINSETPLECSGGIVIVKGEKGSKLTLISGEQQPCIGPWTRTNMSYGRWSPEGTSPKEIIIDACTVVCESKVDGFSIGCYGTNDMPKITLLNGGKLICPETSGNRVILKQAVPPGGSTKISEHMVYGIMKEEDNVIDMVPDEVKTLYLELISKHPEYEDTLSLTTTSKDIIEAYTILAMNPNVDITLLLKSNAHLFIKRCALLLRMPDFEEVVQLDEFRFDAVKKHEFINKLAYNGEEVGQGEAAANLINYLKSSTKNTPHWTFIKEVCYEIIPAYLYDYGEHTGYTKEEHVDTFIEENKHLIHDKYKSMINPDVIDYFLWNKDII